jgi:hypothetical protein
MYLTRDKVQTYDNRSLELWEQTFNLSLSAFSRVPDASEDCRKQLQQAKEGLEIIAEEKERRLALTVGVMDLPHDVKVRVAKEQPDFNRAASAYPEVGLTGRSVTVDRWGRTVSRVLHKTAVEFHGDDLGYHRRGGDSEDEHYFIIYCWTWALEVVDTQDDSVTLT